MLLRFCSALLIALAMLAAPLTVQRGTAQPASTGSAMAMPGHCEPTNDEGKGPSHKATGGSCCVATCAAPGLAAIGVGVPRPSRNPGRPTSDADRLGTLSEIATPPPKRA